MSRYWPWPIWAGGDDPYIFVFRDALGVKLDLTGVQARLTIVWPGNRVDLASGVDAEITIPEQSGEMRGELHIRPTLALTRQLPAGRITPAAVASSAPGTDFSANPSVIGLNGVDGANLQAPSLAARGLRVYRAALEDLTTSARDPLTVLEADWLRFQSRVDAGVFS